MSRIFYTLRLGLMACLLLGFLPLPALATTDGWYTSIKGGITSGPYLDGYADIFSAGGYVIAVSPPLRTTAYGTGDRPVGGRRL